MELLAQLDGFEKLGKVGCSLHSKAEESAPTKGFR